MLRTQAVDDGVDEGVLSTISANGRTPDPTPPAWHNNRPASVKRYASEPPAHQRSEPPAHQRSEQDMHVRSVRGVSSVGPE